MKVLLLILFVYAFFYPTYSQDTIHIPADYSTIQAGVHAANNSDIVLVDEGTYYENLVIVNKAITVASYFIVDSLESHIENTIIDGSQPSSTDSASVIMIFDTFEPVTICGFTLTGGSGKKTIWPNSTFTIAGAGVYIEHSSAEIMNNHIINNSIDNSSPLSVGVLGGGIMWGANIFSGFTLKISGNIISGNEITGVMTGGGGINISNYFIGGQSDYLIEENTIENNTVTNTDFWKAMGGGIFIDFCLPTVGDQIIRNNIIRNNSVNCSHSFGGGIYFIIRDTDSAGTVDNNPGPYVYNNIITGNNSDYLGAGVSVWRAFYFPGHQSIPLQSAGNYVPKPSFINNSIVDNTAPDGSGFYIMNHVPFLMNNIIRNNYPGNAEWGEIFLGDEPIWIEPNHYQGVMMFYNDIQEGWENGDSAAGNIDYDPLFADTLFHLSDSSLCIGAGIDSIEISDTWYYAPLFDFDGDPRPNSPGCLPDVGAQESLQCGPDTTTNIEVLSAEIPNKFSLEQNYPNPFNSFSVVRYSIPQASKVVIKVYDILGSEIATLVNEEKPIGLYKFTWNAVNLPSGVYFYQIKADSFVETKKMLLLK